MMTVRGVALSHEIITVDLFRTDNQPMSSYAMQFCQTDSHETEETAYIVIYFAQSWIYLGINCLGLL